MNQVDQDLFQKYLDGSLVENQVRLFNSRLKSDVEFKENFELYKGMNSFLDEKVKHGDALEKLRGYKHNEIISVENSTNKLWKFLLVLGLLAALILGWTYVNKPIQKRTNQQLYAEYFDPGEVSLVSRGAKSDSLLIEAQGYFNDRDYTSALEYFNKYEATVERVSSEMKLSKVICFINNDMDDLALSSLDELSSQSIELKNDIKWYQGLVALKQGNIELMKGSLIKIEDTSVLYSKAKSLLREF